MCDFISDFGGGAIDPNEGLKFNHIPGGANILFFDGHVEFSKYPQPVNTKYWFNSMERTQY